MDLGAEGLFQAEEGTRTDNDFRAENLFLRGGVKS